MPSPVQEDVVAAARDGLRAWWEAVRGLGDNPIVSASRRLRRPHKKALARLIGLVPWLLLTVVLFGLAVQLTKHYFASSNPYLVTLQVALALLGVYLIWTGTGLFDTSVFALRLLSAPGSFGATQLQFDEAMQMARLTDRDIAMGLLAVCIPRIWMRWFLGPLAALGTWVIYIYTLSRAELSFGSNYLQDGKELFSLAGMIKLLPLSLIALYVTGFLSSCILLLWLIALGRNGRVMWQVQLVALSISVCQVVWILLSVIQLQGWQMDTLSMQSSENLPAQLLSPFIGMGILVATLHFARRRPTLRLNLAALLPPLGLALMWWGILVLFMQDFWLSRFGQPGHWHGELCWVFSGFGLVNVFSLPLPQCVGLSYDYGRFFEAFAPWRLPLLLAYMLIYLAICAHAARLAVADWRLAEE